MEAKLLKVGDVVEVCHPKRGMLLARVHDARTPEQIGGTPFETAEEAARSQREGGVAQNLALVYPARGEPRFLFSMLLMDDGELEWGAFQMRMSEIVPEQRERMRREGCRH